MSPKVELKQNLNRVQKKSAKSRAPISWYGVFYKQVLTNLILQHCKFFLNTRGEHYKLRRWAEVTLLKARVKIKTKTIKWRTTTQDWEQYGRDFFQLQKSQQGEPYFENGFYHRLNIGPFEKCYCQVWRRTNPTN